MPTPTRSPTASDLCAQSFSGTSTLTEHLNFTSGARRSASSMVTTGPMEIRKESIRTKADVTASQSSKPKLDRTKQAKREVEAQAVAYIVGRYCGPTRVGRRSTSLHGRVMTQR